MTGIRFGNAQGPSWPLSRLLRRRSHRSTLPPEFRGSSQPATRGEHPFAGLRALGGKFLRSVGLPRVNLQLHLKVLTYNLKRMCWLKNNGEVAF